MAEVGFNQLSSKIRGKKHWILTKIKFYRRTSQCVRTSIQTSDPVWMIWRGTWLTTREALHHSSQMSAPSSEADAPRRGVISLYGVNLTGTFHVSWPAKFKIFEENKIYSVGHNPAGLYLNVVLSIWDSYNLQLTKPNLNLKQQNYIFIKIMFVVRIQYDVNLQLT